MINDFRLVALGLPALNLLHIPGVVRMMELPWTYPWSKNLLPMPSGYNRKNIGP